MKMVGGEANGVSIMIDKFTPCLLDTQSGEVVQTQYSIASRKELAGLKKKGWNFNWIGKDLKDAEVYKLCIKNDSTIQGLVAIQDVKNSHACYLQLAESAPHNQGVNRRYDGVGGHLFAIAAKKSLDRGYGGFIFLEAKNRELVQHYQDRFGAMLIGGVHQYRMIIDEDAACRLLSQYTLSEE